MVGSPTSPSSNHIHMADDVCWQPGRGTPCFKVWKSKRFDSSSFRFLHQSAEGYFKKVYFPKVILEIIFSESVLERNQSPHFRFETDQQQRPKFRYVHYNIIVECDGGWGRQHWLSTHCERGSSKMGASL